MAKFKIIREYNSYNHNRNNSKMFKESSMNNFYKVNNKKIRIIMIKNKFWNSNNTNNNFSSKNKKSLENPVSSISNSNISRNK